MYFASTGHHFIAQPSSYDTCDSYCNALYIKNNVKEIRLIISGSEALRLVCLFKSLIPFSTHPSKKV